MSDSYKFDKLIQLIKEAASAARKAKKIVTPENDVIEVDTGRYPFALAYLNQAISRMSAAESVYVSCYEILEQAEIETIFQAFDSFATEFLSSLSTDHSLQHTNLYYDDFKKSLYFVNNR